MHGTLSDTGLMVEGEFCIPALVWREWLEAASRKEAYLRTIGKHDGADMMHAVALEYRGRIERLCADARIGGGDDLQP